MEERTQQPHALERSRRTYCSPNVLADCPAFPAAATCVNVRLVLYIFPPDRTRPVMPRKPPASITRHYVKRVALLIASLPVSAFFCGIQEGAFREAKHRRLAPEKGLLTPSAEANNFRLIPEEGTK